ncbi:MAG TPA: YidC/Oxa1 family membrane protein insertase [Solirubrobacteraceae bacterium]|jgi:YidC/Oxa1 family membrane protein insertase|nr:YidC/Oxa1 family membrane protein insertase [Solirubrobacteraceae bacterium]
MPILANIIQEAFSPLISLFEAVLVFLHEHVGLSWGLAIVGLTVLVRAVMTPATVSQIRSMRKMQLVAPELKALKEKYKDDKQRQQEEMMKLYREKGINPFASCLPLVLQLPVFISLFYMLRTDLKKHICGDSLVAHYNALHHTALHSVSQLPAKYIEKTGCQMVAPGSAKFLFIPDITAKATGVVLVVLILLYIGSQVTSTLLMSGSMEPNQRWMMLGLPLIFVVILFRYPAGLLLYWITTNLWTIGQGFIVRRSVAPPPPPPGKGPAPPGSGGSPNGKASGDGAGKGGSVASSGQPALAGVAAAGAAPPPPPRKKKKRSGRRR